MNKGRRRYLKVTKKQLTQIKQLFPSIDNFQDGRDKFEKNRIFYCQENSEIKPKQEIDKSFCDHRAL